MVQEAELRSKQEVTKGDMELASWLKNQMEKHLTSEGSIKDAGKGDIKFELEQKVSKKRYCGECAGCTREPCGNCTSCLELAKVL